MVVDRATALYVPIHKKGYAHRPDSYRPIALLSHVRTVIESTIATTIRTHYTLGERKLGFRNEAVTETAIARFERDTRAMHVTAVLDLGSAYNSVHREKLHSVVPASQNNKMMAMVCFALQPVSVTTQPQKRTSQEGPEQSRKECIGGQR